MAVGITRTQRILLRGSLRCMFVFAPAILLYRILWFATGGSLTWVARVDESDLGKLRLRTTEGAYASWTGDVSIDVVHPSASVWLVALLPSVIVAVAVTVVARVLLRVFHETDAGRPFFGSSARALRLVAGIIAAAAITASIVSSVANAAVVHASLPGVQPLPVPNFTQPASWLVVALVVRVIAEAFRIGTQLRDDTVGLV